MTEEHWPSYSSPITDDKLRLSLEAELNREVGANHQLFGYRVVAKAIGVHRDDVVFALDDGRFAAVHLTWHVESDPEFPHTLLFEDLVSRGRCDEWG